MTGRGVNSPVPAVMCRGKGRYTNTVPRVASIANGPLDGPFQTGKKAQHRTDKPMKILLRSALLAAYLGLDGLWPVRAGEPTLTSTAPDLDTGNKLDLREGLRVYKASCAECHATGKGGAPRLRDAGAWRERSFQSFSVMQRHAENGFLLMPPKGKHPALTGQDVANAVFYMEDRIAERQGKGPEK